MPELFNEALAARTMLERAWSLEATFQDITLAAEDVASRGQCGVSSLWFSRYLVRHEVDARFVEGTIQLDGMDEAYVWVEARRPDTTTKVIDLTSDQFRTMHGTGLHVGI